LQLSLLEGDEYEYFYFVTNTEMPSEKAVIAYEKRGNAENYIKEAKYDMAVGHLLLQSFWANEALCKWNGIPAANQNLSLEVHISGREDHQNGKKRCIETLKKIPLSRDLCKKPSLKKLPFSYLKPLFPFKLDLK